MKAYTYIYKNTEKNLTDLISLTDSEIYAQDSRHKDECFSDLSNEWKNGCAGVFVTDSRFEWDDDEILVEEVKEECGPLPQGWAWLRLPGNSFELCKLN